MIKKKVRDLTIGECSKICNTHDSCINCPLNELVCTYREAVAQMGCTNYVRDLDKEVEVK